MLIWLVFFICCCLCDKDPLDPIQFPDAAIVDTAEQSVFNLTQVLQEYSTLNATDANSTFPSNVSSSHLAKRSIYFYDTISTTIDTQWAYYLDYSPVYMTYLAYSVGFSSPSIVLFIEKSSLDSCLRLYSACNYYPSRSCSSPTTSCYNAFSGLSSSSSYVLLFINPFSSSSSYLTGYYSLYYTTGSPYPTIASQRYGDGMQTTVSSNVISSSWTVIIGCSIFGAFVLVVIIIVIVCKYGRGRSPRVEPDLPQYIPPMSTAQAIPVYPPVGGPPVGDNPYQSPVYYVPMQPSLVPAGSFQMNGSGRVSPVQPY